MKVLPLALAGLLGGAPAFATPYKPDRSFFFSQCPSVHEYRRTSPTTATQAGATKLTAANREAINRLFDIWERDGKGEKAQLAFILATIRRESEGTWLPIREAPGCRDNEVCREEAIGKLLAQRAAKTHKPVPENYAKPAANDKRYYGRGYIQITFGRNYAKADRELNDGTTLVDDPDKVMELSTAGTIAVRGMLEGWFGDHLPLSNWINDHKQDFFNARDNVNPGSPNKAITEMSAKEMLGCLR